MEKQVLDRAHRQWATRPIDQRFWTIEEAKLASFRHYESRVEKAFPLASLRVQPTADNDLALVNPNGGAAEFTNFSFGQFCSMVGAPSAALAKRSAPLVANYLNECIRDTAADREVQCLVYLNGHATVMCMTGMAYARIHNWELLDRLGNLPDGWMIPPARPAHDDPRARPCTVEDLEKWKDFGVGQWIPLGSLIAPAGVYVSDRDMFVFLVNRNRYVDLPGGKEVVYRGFFISQSEFGDRALNVETFNYESICGNHFCWGASNVVSFTFRHVGQIRDKFAPAYAAAIKSADKDTSEERKRITAAQSFDLGQTKDEVIDWITGKSILGAKKAEAAYAVAEQFADIHGSPRSAWGFASGVTRLSQDTGYQNEREVLDRAAGKVLDVAYEVKR